MVCYCITIAAAPTLGPIIGGAFMASGCGWRWTEYLTGIVMMAQFAADVLWLDESHADVLLTRKAHRLRRATGKFALHANVRLRPSRWQPCLDRVCVVCS
jgi:MFS family permease